MDVLVSDHRATGATVVTPVGQLDLDTGPQLQATFDGLRARSVARIVVDLGELTYCDSTGLSALALASNYCTDAGGYLRLAVLSPVVLQLLTTLGIARTVPIYRSVNAACLGDLDGLVAVPGREGPWVVPPNHSNAPNRSNAANRHHVIPRQRSLSATL